LSIASDWVNINFQTPNNPGCVGSPRLKKKLVPSELGEKGGVLRNARRGINTKGLSGSNAHDGKKLNRERRPISGKGLIGSDFR